MQGTGSSDGAIQSDRAASAVIISKAGGAFLWPAEVTADAHMEGNEACSPHMSTVQLFMLHDAFLDSL